MSNSTTDYPPGYLDEYTGGRLKDVAICFMVFNTVFVGLRFYARFLQKRSLKADDYLMIPALLCCYGIQITAFIAVDAGGVGRHVEYTMQHYDMFKTWYETCTIAIAVLYVFAAALPKLAILALYLQIFIDKWSRRGCYATMAALCINIIVMVPLLVYKCDPISYGWKVLLDPNLRGGWCASIEPRLQFASLANIVTDVVMLILPIPTIHRVKTTRTVKVGLVLTFGMAMLGLVMSCFRFASFFKTKAYNDPTWNSVQLVGWCIAEPGIYMFVASQMAFRPLIIKAFHTTSLSHLIHHIPESFPRRHSPERKVSEPKEDEKRLTTPPEELLGINAHHDTIISTSGEHISALPSVYHSHIWVRRDYQVENWSGLSTYQSYS